MISTPFSVPLLLTVALFCLAVKPGQAAQPELIPYSEADQHAACADAGNWVQHSAVKTYFKDSFYDLDKHMRAFIWQAGQSGAAVETVPQSQWPQHFGRLHRQASELIPRLGRLLPRLERQMDLKPMISQMLDSQIWPPRGDHHSEFLRVALAQHMLAVPADTAQDPGQRIAAVLSDFSEVEQLLFRLSSGEAEATDLEALLAHVAVLHLGWRDGFRPIAEAAILAVNPAQLSQQLASAVVAMCREQASCDRNDSHSQMECSQLEQQ